MLGAGRGDTKDYWGMWWMDVLGAGCGDTKDYWGMWFDGTLDCWTIVCSIGWNVLHEVFSYTWAGFLYMKFSPTRGWIVLHEVFSYTWVGFLLVCVFYLIMCDRHMLLANQNYFRSDHFTNLCLFT